MRPTWFYYFTRIGLCLLSIVLFPTFWIFSIGKKKKCAPIENSLLLFSATKLAHMIRTKQVSCEDVMRAYVLRAEVVNKITNAIVEDRFEMALRDAIEIDKIIAQNTKSADEILKETPLLGIPVTIKESIMVSGMSCNVGYAEGTTKTKADRDAYVVQQIKKAGGIITCVTNTPEHCMFWETYNNVTGITRNPYDTRRTTGGSSGGEAALLSSGASVVGIGTDLAGSIRLPAFFTGVYGHKPTPHLISNDGILPKCHDQIYEDFFTTCPMTRYAEDLPLMMSVLAASDSKHSRSDHEQVSIGKLKVFYMENEFNCFISEKVDSSILNAMQSFMNYLKTEHKATIEKIEIKEMCHSYTRAIGLLTTLDKIECQFLDSEHNFNFWQLFLRFITFRSKTTMPIIIYGIAKKIYLKFSNKDNNKLFTEINDLKNNMKNILGENGILIYPTWPTPAHYHFSMFYKMINIGYCTIANLLGFPSTQIPAGFTSNGLPIGFQIISNAHNDYLTIAVAQEAEKYFGGWKQPT